MITLNFNKDEPLFLQLYNHIRNEIIFGNLKSGTPLPSKRNLSNHLGVSVNTVTSAYETLMDEGYIYSKERVGFFVADIDNLINIKNEEKNLISKKFLNYKYDFDLNKNSTFNFPNTNFKKLINESLSLENLLNTRDPKGLYELRNSIANYLLSARGIKTNPQSIIVSSGIEYLFQALFYILPKNSKFTLENPGYKNLLKLFDLNGFKYDFTDVDDYGINPSKIPKNSNIFLVTPSHQFPVGSILPIDRRIKLLNFSNKVSGFIIEDDYDSEFKYYGRPIPALKSLDKIDRVIYISNFSKSISPTLRVSYMILPKDLLKKYEDLKPFLNCPVPNLIQISLSKFIDGGFFERHLNKMRKLYDERRKFALSLFKNQKKFKVFDKKAGLHFILEVDTSISEEELIKYLRDNSIFIQGISNFLSRPIKYKKPRLILGFGNMSKTSLEEGINKIIELINSIS